MASNFQQPLKMCINLNNLDNGDYENLDYGVVMFEQDIFVRAWVLGCGLLWHDFYFNLIG